MIFQRKINRFRPNYLFIYFTVFFVLIAGAGCSLESFTPVGQANADLADIPEITPRPTKALPTPTAVPEYVQADPLIIATEVAVNRINNPPPPTSDPAADTPWGIGSSVPPNVNYPLMEDGANFREIPTGIWYSSQSSAAEVHDYLLDQFTYLRWDKFEISEKGEGYSQIQFEKNFSSVQVNIWENAGLELTMITVIEVDSALEAMRDLPVQTYDQRWVVIGSDSGGVAGIEKKYETELPISLVRLFYVVRMLDAGWQFIPTNRLDTYALDVQFFNDEDQIAILLQDNGVGTTVTLIE